MSICNGFDAYFFKQFDAGKLKLIVSQRLLFLEPWESKRKVSGRFTPKIQS